MFDKEYSFKGSHAVKVNYLTGKFKENVKYGIFARNIDIYIVASIIGFLYGKKSEEDRENKETAKIYGDRIIKSSESLKFNLKLVLLLDKKNIENKNERIDRVFKHFGDEKTEKEDIMLYDSYVRGGIDILYEKLVEASDDYITNLYEFLDEFNRRYYYNISEENFII